MAGKPKASKSKRNSILFKMVSTAGTGFFYLARRNPKQKQEKIQKLEKQKSLFQSFLNKSASVNSSSSANHTSSSTIATSTVAATSAKSTISNSAQKESVELSCSEILAIEDSEAEFAMKLLNANYVPLDVKETALVQLKAIQQRKVERRVRLLKNILI